MKQRQDNTSNQELDHNNPSGGVQTLDETPTDWNPTPEQIKKSKEIMARDKKRDWRVEKAVTASMKRHPGLTREKALEMLDLMV